PRPRLLPRVAAFEFYQPVCRTTRLVRRMSPHARKAIRLELQSHRQLIRVRSILRLQLPHSRLDAEQRLHVVTNFVRDDIRFGEIAGRSKATAEFGEEAKIQI